jgi:hypothetical protein
MFAIAYFGGVAVLAACLSFVGVGLARLIRAGRDDLAERRRNGRGNAPTVTASPPREPVCLDCLWPVTKCECSILPTADRLSLEAQSAQLWDRR